MRTISKLRPSANRGSEKTSRVRRLKHIAGYLGPSAILLLVGLLFSSTGRDDAHITYWSAYSLSRFGEILNYNGDRVEQSSSLLQVLLLSLIGLLSGAKMVSIGKISSIVFGIASLMAIYRLVLKIDSRTAFPTAVLTGTSVYFIYWSYGGLESTLVAFTVLCLIMAYADYLNAPTRYHLHEHYITLIWSLTATALFLLVRPEMPLVLICMLIGTIVVIYFKKATAGHEKVTQYQDLLYRSFLLLGISTIISVLVFMFRIWYFGSLFPQPVMAKSTGLSLDSLRLGIDYFYTNLLGADPYLSILAMLAAFGAGYAGWDQIKAKTLNPLILFSLLFLAAYSSFILLSGGDWMEGGRFFVHLLPVAVMFIPFALLHLGKSKLLLTIATVALLIIQAKTIVNFATHKSTGVPIWGLASFEESLEKYDVSNFSWFEKYNLLNLRDIPVIYYLSDFVERIADYKTDTVSIMSGQMGMVPYHIAKKYFGQVRLIDRNGLADRTFTTCQITRNLSRTRWGLRVSYYFYFDNQKAIEEHCGLVRPDIIFGLGLHDDMIALLAKNNFTVMYYQSGYVVIGNRTWLSGRKVTADGEFIAIRNDLLPALHGIKPIHLDFSKLGVSSRNGQNRTFSLQASE